MKYASAMLLIVLGCFVPSHAQEPKPKPEGMSAVDIADALTSPTQARRDRGAIELGLMNEATARALGTEISRLGVREAETCLKAVGIADSDSAAIAGCVALDSAEFEVRAAALDALIGMHPKHVGEHCDKLLRARAPILRKLIVEEDYLKLLAEGVKAGENGLPEKPVERAMSLTILVDRHMGAGGMPLLVNGFARLMLGEDNEAKLGAAMRFLNERRRRGATVWCETIWVADPSVQFNYSPTAPWKDREDAVNRLGAKLSELQKRETSLDGNAYTGLRYGDYLIELYGSDVSETKAAAYLRTRWWRGDDVTIAGEGYADAVDTFNAMNNRELGRLRRDLYRWWYDYRKATEIN
ncbi:MAG: hypothetical protein K8I27_14475 [Planctomycetes bacterium]|nr:hypothetical protein [Planctomycetota bacterium]